jgi:hypothetical protein
MNDSEWLAQLKVGGEVIIHARQKADIYIITKTTKTQITANNVRFNRHGRQIGGERFWSLWLQQHGRF